MKRRNVEKSRYLRRNQTDAERKLWSALRNRALSGVKFRRQHQFNKYILDFYSPDHKLCVEADGGRHYSGIGLKRDIERTRCLNESGIQVLRFSNRDIFMNIDGVSKVILDAAEKRGPSTLPSPQREKGQKIVEG